MRNATKAAKYYKEYLTRNETDTTAWRELALILEKSNNLSEAAFCYKKLTELLPDNGEYWYKYGSLEFDLHSYDEAGTALEKAISLGSNVADSYKKLAKVYQLKKEYYCALQYVILQRIINCYAEGLCE